MRVLPLFNVEIRILPELGIELGTPGSKPNTLSTRLSVHPWFPLQDRNSFRKIVLKSAFLKRRMYEEFINSVPILKSLEVNIISVNAGHGAYHTSYAVIGFLRL